MQDGESRHGLEETTGPCYSAYKRRTLSHTGVIEMQRLHRSRLLLADDHTLIAEACRNLLEPEFEVVGIVSDGRALLQAAAELRPDVAILDIAMPLLNGLDAGEQIKQKNRA